LTKKGIAVPVCINLLCCALIVHERHVGCQGETFAQMKIFVISVFGNAKNGAMPETGAATLPDAAPVGESVRLLYEMLLQKCIHFCQRLLAG